MYQTLANGLLCTIFGLIFVHILIQPRLYASIDRLRIASRVRDQDETRVAVANSQIGKWRLAGKLPLSLNQMFNYGGFSRVLILVTTSNRGHSKIDAFEPLYLTQTSINLVKQLKRSKNDTYKNLGTIIPMFCAVLHANDSKGDSFYMELERLKTVLGRDSFLHTTVINTGRCKINLDMVACLKLAMRFYPTIDNFVLIEDDFIVTPEFLPVLESYSGLHRNVLQLYSEPSIAYYDPMINNIVVFLYVLTALPTFVAAYFSVPGRSFKRIFSAFFAGILLVLAVTWISSGARQTGEFKIVPQRNDSTFSGAVVAFPKQFAELLVESSAVFEMESKEKLLQKLAQVLHYDISEVNPSPVVHIGMYSQTQSHLYDPLLFPH